MTRYVVVLEALGAHFKYEVDALEGVQAISFARTHLRERLVDQSAEIEHTFCGSSVDTAAGATSGVIGWEVTSGDARVVLLPMDKTRASIVAWMRRTADLYEAYPDLVGTGYANVWRIIAALVERGEDELPVSPVR